MDIASIKQLLGTTALDLALKVLAALAFWFIGRWLIGRVVSVMRAALNRNHVDPTLIKYLGSIVAVALNIALALGILGYFGVQTTSFAAMLAGAGVAIGAAWSGMLGNFAAGAFMLILRPFKVGDFVSVGGVTGTVHELGLFGTTIVTPDNVMTLVGNGKIFGDTIQNFSALPVRRVERTAQLAGGVDALEAIERLRAAVVKIPNVATDPAPEVSLLDMNLVGPVISVRRALLAGVFRHQRGHRPHGTRGRLACTDAEPDHPAGLSYRRHRRQGRGLRTRPCRSVPSRRGRRSASPPRSLPAAWRHRPSRPPARRTPRGIPRRSG